MATAKKKSKTAKKKTAKKTVSSAKGRRTAAGRGASVKVAPRADYGRPIDGFFAKQPATLRPIAEAVRALVEEAAPDATSSLKWGMPVYMLNGVMMCAIGGHKAHINLILSGPDGTYDDPDGRLTGESKNGRHLKLTTLDELPREAVRRWLRVAVALARG